MRTREERNGSRYEQFEISPETIEQELCRLRIAIDSFRENYNIDPCITATLQQGIIS